MYSLRKKSNKVRSQASKILKESGILNILKDYGEIKIGGSYALDVMLRPDIDIFVVTKQHNWKKVLDIQSRIMKTKYFRELDFVNWVDFNDPSLTSMRGYYFKPWVLVNNVLWKIDIWLITPEQDKSSETTDYFKKLLQKSESKKITILKIKNAMLQGRKYIPGIDGKLIYKAVLEHGITTAKDFKKFIL